ncbi:hypothetical protein KFK09_028498 [Dendrobium nobile]|uniref:Uncharacterized protein n=1 Tax=Dendrobium nobile TaxID=94219 RepID=A0A8T3A3G8_DENNO|nr:hypothetical protein KFK09_028498 [Dendrobium nobile]
MQETSGRRQKERGNSVPRCAEFFEKLGTPRSEDVSLAFIPIPHSRFKPPTPFLFSGEPRARDRLRRRRLCLVPSTFVTSSGGSTFGLRRFFNADGRRLCPQDCRR